MASETKVYDIAIAGILHDIGKFVQRCSVLKDEFKKSGIKNDDFGYEHTAWTYFFLNKYKEYFNDDIIRLASSLHKPELTETDEQIIQYAYLADSFNLDFAAGEYIAECKTQDKDDKISEIPVCEPKNWAKQRLKPIFLNIQPEQVVPDYQYPLGEISAHNPFLAYPYNAVFHGEHLYDALYEKFILAFENNLKSNKDNKAAMLNGLKDIFYQFLSYVPADTYGDAENSLFEHLAISSALSSAMYRYEEMKYHNPTEGENQVEIPEEELSKVHIFDLGMLMIHLRLNSEDNYELFSSIHNLDIPKLAIGRNFIDEQILKIMSYTVCDELEIPYSNIMYSSTEEVYIIGYSTNYSRTILNGLETNANKSLLEKYYGKKSISVSHANFSINELRHSGFKPVCQMLKTHITIKRAQKLGSILHNNKTWQAGFVFNDKIREDSRQCPVCKFHLITDDSDLCENCKVELAAGIGVLNSNFICYSDNDDLKYKILNRSFEFSDKISKHHKFHEKINDFYDYSSPTDCISRFVGFYIPNNLNCVEKCSSMIIDINDIEEYLKSFIFDAGLNLLSNYFHLTKIINSFFTLYVPNLVKRYYSDRICLLQSSGNRLFAVGNWLAMIDFAGQIYNKFLEFTCRKMRMSAGLSMVDSESLLKFAHLRAEKSIEIAQDESIGKDAINVLGVQLKWRDFVDVQNRYGLYSQAISLTDWLKSGKFPISALNELLEISNDAKELNEIKVSNAPLEKHLYLSKLNRVFGTYFNYSEDEKEIYYWVRDLIPNNSSITRESAKIHREKLSNLAFVLKYAKTSVFDKTQNKCYDIDI